MDIKHKFDHAHLKNPRPKPRVRDTEITVYEVYRCLMSHGLTEEAVLNKYRALKPEDLPAVREAIRVEIRSRSRDEITGRPLLAKDRLVDGRYYKGRCRNATVARWNASENRFYHWRVKFERVYIETIMYPTDETEPWWDVFDVVEELLHSKFEIPFEETAVFQGNQEDLYEFTEEMWSKWAGRFKNSADRTESE